MVIIAEQQMLAAFEVSDDWNVGPATFSRSAAQIDHRDEIGIAGLTLVPRRNDAFANALKS